MAADTYVQYKTDGTRLTPGQVRRGMSLSTIAGSMANMWVALPGIPLTMMMECLKASGVMLGAVVTVQQLATVAQVVGALVAERFRTKKGVWFVLAIVHRGVWFLPVGLAFLAPHRPALAATILVWLVAGSAIFAQMSAGLWYSWMADLVPERMRSRYWAGRISIVTLAYLFGLALFGYLLDRFPDPRQPDGSWTGFAIVFAIGAAIGCIDIFVHLFVPEPHSAPPQRRESMVRYILAPLRDPDFRALTMSMGIWTFGVGILGAFPIVYVTRTFGVSYSLLSAWLICSSISTAVTGFLWGRLMQRTGARTFGALMMLMGPVAGLSWFFLADRPVELALPLLGVQSLPQAMIVLCATSLLAGGFYAGVSLCQLNLTAALAPKGAEKTVWISLHFTFAGLMGAAGPLAGGAIVDYMAAHPIHVRLPGGIELAFMQVLVAVHMGVSWFVALPFLLRIRKGREDMPFTTALSRVFVDNPWKLATTVYAVGITFTTRALAAAAKEIGGPARSMAVTHLIEQLGNPNRAVREEAVHALGSIGSPEAVAALVRHLETQDTDLAPEIARALRSAKSGREVGILMRKLSDTDNRSVVGAVRALGEIGGGQAAEPILALLRASTDTQVVAASSEALARIGEIAAIWELLPRVKAARNPVLRASLLSAVGDLLGGRPGFADFLRGEEEFRGSEVAPALTRLRRAVRKATRGHLRPEGAAVIRQIDELEQAYDAEEMQRTADLLLEIAIGIAALDFGIEFGGDAEILMDQLIWRHPRFGVGLWYIDMLSHYWEGAGLGQREWPDIVLGLYFVVTHGESITA